MEKIRQADLLDQRNCPVAPGRQYLTDITKIGPILAACLAVLLSYWGAEWFGAISF
jgi:hypothetical protein